MSEQIYVLSSSQTVDFANTIDLNDSGTTAALNDFTSMAITNAYKTLNEFASANNYRFHCVAVSHTLLLQDKIYNSVDELYNAGYSKDDMERFIMQLPITIPNKTAFIQVSITVTLYNKVD